MGKYFFREQRPKDELGGNIYNINSKEHVHRVWGEPQEAKPYSYYKKKGIILENVKDNELIIWIHPHETILCHTNEFIGGKTRVTTMMKARSSFGRNFLAACRCAGFGDISYTSIWTMEINSSSSYYKIPLLVGRRVAQLIFLDTGKQIDPCTTYEKTGKYQSTNDLDELIKTWRPEYMLPKMYQDYENDKSHIPQWFNIHK